jgi:uncharacterized membrane protein
MRGLRLLGLWEQLRTSFWFVPSLMTVASIILSFGLVKVDEWLATDTIKQISWLYQFGPEGARAILAAIASSMITVAGLSFSMTMLTLQLASAQFGPRVLRNLMRDRGNQVVLGTFISTFLYCLLVLRVVRGVEGSSFVPHLSVAFGILLAIASLAVLIYFIHHIASSIRLETILAGLAAEAFDVLATLYPEKRVKTRATTKPQTPPSDFEQNCCEIRTSESGYLQQLDEDAIIRLAEKYDLLVRVEKRVGEFICKGEIVLRAYPKPGDNDIFLEFRDAFAVGQERTPAQDIEFAVWRLVEIAQRALSADRNDPSTAIYCIDRLGEVFSEWAERIARQDKRPNREMRPNREPVRLISAHPNFEEFTAKAFEAVARYAGHDAQVLDHLQNTRAKVFAQLSG